MAFFALLLAVSVFSNYSSAADSEYAETRYPIMLVGGSFINFDKLGPIEFFYRIPAALKAQGADVHVATVSPLNSPQVRGEQLARQVEELIAITGREKVNLISISSGGLTARYTASVYPNLIASVTTINAGHAGTPLADKGVALVEFFPNWFQSLIWKIGNSVSRLIAWLAGDSLPLDAERLAYYHTTEGSRIFSEAHPEGQPTEYCGQGDELASNGVRYYSYAGSHVFTNWLDPADYILSLTKLLMDEPSDGAFGACSSHWGLNIRDDLYLNHLDEANHLFGLHSPRLEPKSIYLQQANRLKLLGL